MLQINTSKMSSSTDTPLLNDSNDPIIATETPAAPDLKTSVCNIVNDLKSDCNANTEQAQKLNNGIAKPQNTDGNKERDKHENKLPKLKINLQNIDQTQLVNDLSKLRSPMDDKNSSKLVIAHRKDRRDSFPISSKQKQPVMGKTALLKKANIDTDSHIIQSIILNKYDNVLSHYVSRMYKRRASRHSSSEFSEDEYNESPSPYPVYSPSTVSAICGSGTDTPRSVGSERSRFEFPTVGDYKYPFYAANYYVPRRSLEFLKSTDDFNLETTSEEFDDSVVTSDTGQADVSDYDPATFLENALGELKSLKSVSQSDFHDTNMEKRPGDQSVGPSNVSTLLSKAGSIYSSAKKNIKRRRHSLKSACLDEHLINHHSPGTNRLLENLKKELSIQNSIMFQISKALNFCRASKEFVSGKEHIEAEKILLVATITKEALIAEINAIEFKTYENNFDPRCSGTIRICTVAVHLKKKTSAAVRATESKEYFLAVAACGKKIVASEVLEATDDAVLFRKCFEFDNLLADFEISLSIYSMNVRNRGHIIQENMKCPSPKNILGCTRDTRRNRDTNTTVYIEPLAFTLLGRCFMRNQELSKAKSSESVTLKLQNIPSHSSIAEYVEVKIDQAHNLTNKISGFVTIGIENEQSVTTWNRRWCLLEGSVFKYWNYPSEEEEAEPLGSFDLCYSLAQKIIPADRKICARPRTLMIPIQSGNAEKKYFLSGDTSADMGIWETELNFVIQSLMIWNGLKCPLSPS